MNKAFYLLVSLLLLTSIGFSVTFVKQNIGGTDYVFGYEEKTATQLNASLIGPFLSQVINLTNIDSCKINKTGIILKEKTNTFSNWERTFTNPGYYFITLTNNILSVALSALGVNSGTQCNGGTSGEESEETTTINLATDPSVMVHLTFDNTLADAKGNLVLKEEYGSKGYRTDAKKGTSVEYGQFGWWDSGRIKYTSKKSFDVKTISLWMKDLANDEPDEEAVSIALTYYDEIYLHTGSDGTTSNIICAHNTRTKDIELKYEMPINQFRGVWTHVICTLNDTKITLYINGTKVKEVTGGANTGFTMSNGPYPLWLFTAGNDNTQDFQGMMDEFVILNKTVNDVTAKALFTASTG